MANVPNDASELMTHYSRKRKQIEQMRACALLIIPIAFAALAAHRVALFGADHLRNLYASVGLEWVALYLAMSCVLLPFSVYRHRVDTAFNIARANLLTWLLDYLKANLVAAGFGLLLLELIFAAMNLPGDYAWLKAAIGVSFLYAALVYVVPRTLAFFYRLSPLDNPGLCARLASLAKKAGVQIEAVYQWHISSRTRRANAMLAGIGPHRRIIITDTLTEDLSEEEIETIVAHEFGHFVHHDLYKRLLLQTAIFVPLFWLIRGMIVFGLVPFADAHWNNPEIVPSVWLCWLVLSIYGNMVMTSLTRRQERAADRFALNLVPNALVFASALRKIQEKNLFSYEKKSEWQYSHPATSERIAAAEQYARDHGQTSEAAMAQTV